MAAWPAGGFPLPGLSRLNDAVPGIQADDDDVAPCVKERACNHAVGLLTQPGKDHSGEKGRKVPPLKQHNGVLIILGKER